MTESERMAEIRRIKQQVEEALLKLPGVTGVDIGHKVVGGEPTGELAIRVYVATKLPPEEIPASEKIPETIQDVPTDVIERRYVLHPGISGAVAMDTGTDQAEAKGAHQ